MREFSGCFKEVSRVFHESFMGEEVSRMLFLRLFHDFRGCFQSASRKFQENFQGVSKKFHVAWHSSQLPEQKEGLLILYV